MGLLITNAKFKNTDIEVLQVYARIQYFAHADGKKVNAKLIVAKDKADALAWTMGENQNQDLVTIHELIKGVLEIAGFGVTIDLA